MKNREIKPISYEAAHNRAVRHYKKMSIFLLWAGVLNVMTAVVAVVKGGGNDYSMCFAFNQILFLLLGSTSLPAVTQIVLVVAIAVISGAAFALLGYFASLGSKVCLFTGGILYFLDFVALFIWISPNSSSYVLSIVMHALFLFSIMAALFAYYSVIAVEKKFNKQ